MPSGAKKRKAAKKKQVHNPSSTNPGENDGGELTSPTSENQNAQDPSVETVNKDGDSSESKTIETESKSKSSSSGSSDSSEDESNQKKEVAITESTPIESIPETETVPEKIEEVEVSAIVDPIDEPIPAIETSPETIPDEVVKVYDETKEEEREEVIVPETVVEEEVTVSDVVVKDETDEVVEELVVESVSRDVELPSEPVTLSTSPDDHADETGTVEHTDRQVKVTPPPITEEKASWKNCCGIFELFSGSAR